MKPEKRLANINIMTKRLVELDQNYPAVRGAIHNVAHEMKVPVSEIKFNKESREDFE